ncbi:hypothetical protein [Algisphaera agarilytica]|nr:hypothetical protein [Algisphaera agarilytica]
MRTMTAAVLSLTLTSTSAAAGDGPWTPQTYGSDFSQTWHDGNAEMATYNLTYPRYGELRTGTAVAITVTEPFNPDKRVKSDTGGEGTHNVIKLNLVEDFQTGLYDYNLMTSVFVATSTVNGLPAGSPTKVSFSSQEWCGHVYQQALFSQHKTRSPGVRQSVHSYFETEADQQITMSYPVGGIAEDALIMWARGLAGPSIGPGESIDAPVYRSMALQRLLHVPGKWEDATLSRQSEPETVSTPAGNFECEVFTAEVAGVRTYTFYIDRAEDGDRRLVKLARSDGYAMELTAVERMPYWQLNRNADEKKLKEIGLERRGEGTM